jgi:NtrC-family two-component system response regulator AlgB
MSEPNSKSSLPVLVVDDEANIRRTLTVSLEADGHSVSTAASAADALKQAAARPFAVAFVDLRLGTETGLDLIPRLLNQSPLLKIIVITAYASVDTAVQAMRAGAADYLPKPFTPAQVRIALERAVRLRGLEQRVAGLEGALGDAESSIDVESQSEKMRQALDLARQVANSDATVLLRGESGTGKGLLARAIHFWSNRAQRSFAIVACPSLSAQLLESELFGHVRGAFTGAVRDNPGRIAGCEGGTLFLDEIGELPMQLQPKLLRFLQDRQYERVGDATTRHADVRVLAATNAQLEQAVREKRFREDLLYRINVIQIELPPLRDRAVDILPLARTLLAQFGRERKVGPLSDEVSAALQMFNWPGNVRELRNVIERAAILCDGGPIELRHLPVGLTGAPASGVEPQLGDPVTFERIEAVHIRRLIERSPSLEDAAKALGIDVGTLWRKRKKYGI